MQPFSSTYLLAFALLRQKGKRHLLWTGFGKFFRHFLVFRSVASILGRDWYCHIKLGLSLELARLEALCHHTAEFSFEVCRVFGVDFFLLPRDDDVLFFGIRPVCRMARFIFILPTISQWTKSRPCQKRTVSYLEHIVLRLRFFVNVALRFKHESIAIVILGIIFRASVLAFSRLTGPLQLLLLGKRQLQSRRCFLEVWGELPLGASQTEGILHCEIYLHRQGVLGMDVVLR